MNTPETQFTVLLKQIYNILKPLGYKKEGNNFRLFAQDGLGKIICVNRNRWNSGDNLLFSLDIAFILRRTQSFKTFGSRRLNVSFGK